MSLEEKELEIRALEEKIISLSNLDPNYEKLKKDLEILKEDTYKNLTAWDRVSIARSNKRIKSSDLIDKMFDNFIELKGDQLYREDSSIIAGIGFLKDMPVTVLAQAKGKNIDENIKRNFGMTSPEGFRKTLRLAHQAEKFNRPIITIVDTSGAYPGKGAEERGQARAIARNLMEFSSLNVPVISIVLSEGGSGGALALTISDYIYMFENAVYSVLSPEGFASILFKDTSNVKEIASIMKLTSFDLKNEGIIDEIITEPLGGIKNITEDFKELLKNNIYNKIKELSELPRKKLVDSRYGKFRKIGVNYGN